VLGRLALSSFAIFVSVGVSLERGAATCGSCPYFNGDGTIEQRDIAPLIYDIDAPRHIGFEFENVFEFKLRPRFSPTASHIFVLFR